MTVHRRRAAVPLTLLALTVLGFAAVDATRSAAPQSQHQATQPIDYRPGAYMPEDFPLHGVVRLLSAPTLEAGKRARIRIEYEVGDRGLAAGESLEIWKHFTSDVEEFQTEDSEAPAYIGAETTAAGVELRTIQFTNHVQSNKPSVFPYRKTAGVVITQGSLDKGDKIHFDLGGRLGVRMQSYEENLFNFRVVIGRASDGKVLGYGGDAVMKVVGGPARKLRVQAPSIVGAREGFTVEVVPQDEWGSLARNARGLDLGIVSESVGSSELVYEPDLMHFVARNVTAPANPGVVRIEVRSPDGALRGVSNPIRVEAHPVRRVFYGDLHQHAYLHDGRGVFDELYLYARQVGMLDFAAITPHHAPMSVTGPRFYLDDYSDQRDHWPELVEANKRWKNWKGLTTILGYEYSVGTSDGGHHNVFYNADEAPTVMQLEPNDVSAPVGKMLQVLERVRKPSLVIPHVGGGPPDWEHPDNPRLERLFEIASVHGVFEESWKKHLEAGLRLAASASGDNHTTGFGNSYPGLIYTMTNPLTGVWAHENNRGAVWDALSQRRTFAATGNKRILLDFSVNGEPMGGELAAVQASTAKISVRVAATAPLTRVEIVKNNQVAYSVAPSRNRGKLMRVKWGDNLYQRRANISLSEGSLSSASGTLFLRRILQRDQSFESIRQDGDAVRWRASTTSNDRDAFLVDVSDAAGDSLRFRLEDAKFGTLGADIPLDKLRQDGHFAWQSPPNSPIEHSYMQKMGVEPTFFLECELVNPEGPMDLNLTFEDREQPTPGDYYYLRIEQLDTNLAWSSPVWFN